MQQTLKKTFIYAGKRVQASDHYDTSKAWLELKVNGHVEPVEPVEGGFITGPRSRISRVFGRQGSMYIEADCGSEFAERLRKYRLSCSNEENRKWLWEHTGAQAVIVYGEIAPKKHIGWYVVLAMRKSAYGGYVNYIEPRHKFLGVHNSVCEKVRREKGVHDIYRNGLEFLATEVSREEVAEFINYYNKNRSE